MERGLGGSTSPMEEELRGDRCNWARVVEKAVVSLGVNSLQEVDSDQQ